MSPTKETNLATAAEVGANVLYPTTVFFASQLFGADPQTSAVLAGTTFVFRNGYQNGRAYFAADQDKLIEQVLTPTKEAYEPKKAAFVKSTASSIGRNAGLSIRSGLLLNDMTTAALTGMATLATYTLGVLTGGMKASSDTGEHKGRFSRRMRRTAGGILAGSLLGLAYQNQDMFLPKTEKTPHKMTASAPVPPTSKNAVAFVM